MNLRAGASRRPSKESGSYERKLMDRILRSVVASGAALVALAVAPALAGVGYSVVLESPEPVDGEAVVRGTVAVRARAEGGLGDASSAAYDARPSDGVWAGTRSVPMDPVAPSTFDGREQWRTAPLLNGEHELEVRIWGDVPAYDPDNANTFARRVITVLVDNPPEPPAVRGQTGAGSIRLSWAAAEASKRSDFYGHRVWIARGPGCPNDPEMYDLAGESSTSSWTQLGVRPGRRCYRVTATRTSPVSGIIDSAFSAPLRLVVPASGAPVVGAPEAGAPAARADRPSGKTRKKEGRFEEVLPYATPQMVEPGEDEVVAAIGAEPARSGEEASHRVAAGLILLVAAIHLRRLVSRPAVRR